MMYKTHSFQLMFIISFKQSKFLQILLTQDSHISNLAHGHLFVHLKLTIYSFEPFLEGGDQFFDLVHFFVLAFAVLSGLIKLYTSNDLYLLHILSKAIIFDDGVYFLDAFT